MKRYQFVLCRKGFTLIELMVGLAVTGIVATGILSGYLVLTHQVKEQRDIAVMQMNQRGSIENMELEFRMAGYDPVNNAPAGTFGVYDVRRYSITDGGTAPALDPAGSDSITIVYDDYLSGPADGVLDATDTYISFRLFDENGNGRTSLARDRLSGDLATFSIPREVLADNIHALAFAYAVDEDGDGLLDRAPGNEIIWAIDTNNDNVLDFNIDANGDGVLDLNDDVNGDFVIDAADTQSNGLMSGTAQLTSIRQIRVWLLARSESPKDGYINKDEYRVGDRILSAANGDINPNLKCLLLVRAIECRNLVTTP